MSTNKCKDVSLKGYKDCKAFTEYSDMEDILGNIENDNLQEEHKTLVTFDDMIANMFSNKKRNAVVTDLVIRGRKLDISSLSKKILNYILHTMLL